MLLRPTAEEDVNSTVVTERRKRKWKNEAQRGRNLGTKAWLAKPTPVFVCVAEVRLGDGGLFNIQASEEREKKRQMHVHSGGEIWLCADSEEQP